jgi:hypothetical protein
MSKVFVPQVPTRRAVGSRDLVPVFDLSPAKGFGELVVLQPANTASMFFPVPTVRELKDKLRGFGEEDYVLAIGDPSLIATVSMLAGERNHGRVKMLKWDRLQRCYIAVQIDTTGRPT